MLRLHSGVRRSGRSLQTVQGGRRGAVLRQGRRHFPPSWQAGRGRLSHCGANLRRARGVAAAQIGLEGGDGGGRQSRRDLGVELARLDVGGDACQLTSVGVVARERRGRGEGGEAREARQGRVRGGEGAGERVARRWRRREGVVAGGRSVHGRAVSEGANGRGAGRAGQEAEHEAGGGRRRLENPSAMRRPSVSRSESKRAGSETKFASRMPSRLSRAAKRACTYKAACEGRQGGGGEGGGGGGE